MKLKKEGFLIMLKEGSPDSVEMYRIARSISNSSCRSKSGHGGSLGRSWKKTFR